MKFSFFSKLFRIAAAMIISMAATSASAAICQFIPASGAWNVPANWANCTGGDGVPLGVPGPSDRAEVTGKTAILPSGSTSVGDLYLGAAVLQGAGLANTTLNVVNAGGIAWASGSYTFQDMTAVFTSTSTIPAANGPMMINNAVLELATPSTAMAADSIVITGVGAKILNGGVFHPSTSLSMTLGGAFETTASGFCNPLVPVTINGTFLNRGAFLVDPGVLVTLSLPGSFLQSDPTAYIGGSGTISALGQTLTIANGFIEGNVTFNLGTLNNTGAVVSPGGVNANGSVNVNGNYTASGLAGLDIDIAGGMISPVFDRLVVSGSATFSGGTVVFTYIDTGFSTYVPNQGDSFNVVDAGVVSGTFAVFNRPVGGNVIDLIYTPMFVQFVVGPLIAIVSNTNDSGPGSLRNAIGLINGCDVSNVEIVFDLGVSGGTITPLTQLPTINCPLKIRGYSQFGSSPNTSFSDWNGVLNVTLDGSSCAGCIGLTIGRENVEVEGINFANWNTALQVNGGITDNAHIKGNYFFQGGVGVAHNGGANVLIGGAPLSERNVFVHATGVGILSSGLGVVIRNNIIGAGAGLVLGANARGIFFNGGNDALVAQNIIVNNGKGVVVGAGTMIRLDNNKIYDNTIIGVDLGDDGPTINDPADSDTGPNGLVNFPVITSASLVSGDLVINYTLDTTPVTSFNVFACVTSPPGAQNQCKLPVGGGSGVTATGPFSGNITITAANLASFGATFPATVTLFTTLASGPDAGATSEFSAGVLAAAAGPTIAVTGSTTFPTTAVGASSAVQTITITNTGGSNLSIASITNSNVAVFKDTVNGAPPQAAHYCGLGSNASGAPLTGGPIIVAPAATCNLVLVFSPNAAGPLTGIITINSNAPTSPTTITLTGTGVALPVITSPNTAGGVVGSAFTYQITATNSPTLYGIAAIPLGLSFNTATGLLSGIPTAAGSGVTTISATNGGGTGTQGLTITITAAAVAPTITSAAPPSGTVGTFYSHSFTATGTTPITWSIATGTLPPGVTLNATSGLFSGTPTASGTFGFTLQAANGTLPNATVNVSVVIAAAAVPGVNLAPASVAFGTRTANTTSPPTTVTLTNSGTGNLIITSITGSGDFGFTSTCPISTPPVVPAGTCPINITFTPLTVAALSGAITIVSNAPGSPHTVPLSGTGSAAAVAGISLSPATLGFGGQAINTASFIQSVIVTNTGFANLTISGISVAPPFNRASLGVVTPPNCGATVAPGSSCQIGVTFSPTALGAATGQISIIDNAAGSPHTVSLSGTGTTIPVPMISTNGALNFGDQIINAASTVQNLTISNIGTATLNVSAITLTGTNAANFTLAGQSGCISIAAGGSCTLVVTFSTTSTGAKAAQINITSNAQNTPVTTVSLTANGILAPRAVVNLSATVVGYGNVIFGGATPNQIITLTNSGGQAMAIPNMLVTGDFVQMNNCGTSLASLASCTISILFTPLGQGSRFGEFVLTTSAATSPDRIQLSGTGCRWFSQTQNRFFITNCGG